MRKEGGPPITVSPWLLPVMALAFYVGQGGVFFVWMLAIFLHELCHAAVAARLGAVVEEIRILPYGCVAKMENSACVTPGCEALTALAGPACNLFLAMLTALWYQLIGMPDAWMKLLLTANLALCALNLLPGLPLDGGVLLRALLLPRLGYTRATRLLAGMGMGLGMILAGAFVAGALGGTYNVTLLGFALFLFISAGRTYREAAFFLPARWQYGRRDAFQPVRHLAVEADTPLVEVFRRWVPRRYHLITVVDEGGKCLGTLDEQALWQGISRLGHQQPIRALRGDFH